jgi:hypothetical protein
MLYQPNWAYENFWSKADFYDSIPFTVPYLAFLFIYSAITTALAEFGIRFIKKYAYVLGYCLMGYPVSAGITRFPYGFIYS